MRGEHVGTGYGRVVCEEARQEAVVRSSCQARASRSGGRRSLLGNPKHTEVGGSGESCRSANASYRRATTYFYFCSAAAVQQQTAAVRHCPRRRM